VEVLVVEEATVVVVAAAAAVSLSCGLLFDKEEEEEDPEGLPRGMTETKSPWTKDVLPPTKTAIEAKNKTCRERIGIVCIRNVSQRCKGHRLFYFSMVP
jgi:hypothetical protein